MLAVAFEGAVRNCNLYGRSLVVLVTPQASKENVVSNGVNTSRM